MSRSSGRGQTEPLVALVAVLAVCVGLSLYAGIIDGVLTTSTPTPSPTADRAVATLAPAGVARPERLPHATRAAPDGHAVNLTFTAGRERWTVGPTPPDGSPSARRHVAVRRGPGHVVPGRLRVVVWS